MAIELVRRSFLIGLASALVVPAVVKLEAAERALGGQVVSACVAPEMTWRRVFDICVHCERSDGKPLASRTVAISVGRSGNLPLLHSVFNQAGSQYRWLACIPVHELLFSLEKPMVITCEPAPEDCDAFINILFHAKDGMDYNEALVWRDDRLISRSLTPLWVGEKPKFELSDEKHAEMRAYLDADEW